MLLVIGPTSKVFVTGLSTAFDTLLAGLVERSIPHQVLDSSSGMSNRATGKLSVKRAIAVLILLGRYVWLLPRAKVIYVTMGGSKLGFLRDFFIINLAVIFRRRVVLHLHGGGYKDFYSNCRPWLQSIITSTLCKVDTIIVLGELLRDQFDFLPSDKTKNVKVVTNGLPYDVLVSKSSKELPEDGDRLIRLLYLSNMIPSKGYLMILDACRILKERASIRFVCDFAGEFISTGSGKDQMDPDFARNQFLDLIRRWKLIDNVKYHGVVKGVEKSNLLSSSHIFILPTQYPGEGQPISIIEALSYATPVISTKYRGIPEQIDDGGNGILLESVQAESIANAIEEIGLDSFKYRCMSKRSSEIFNTRFTKSHYLDRLIPTIFWGVS